MNGYGEMIECKANLETSCVHFFIKYFGDRERESTKSAKQEDQQVFWILKFSIH